MWIEEVTYCNIDIFILKCGQSSGGELQKIADIATQQHYATNIRMLMNLRVISWRYYHHVILCQHEGRPSPSIASQNLFT